MKILLIYLFIILAVNVNAQNRKTSLDGKVYVGTFTENTPPDVDRRPLVYYDTIRFINGKIFSDALFDALSEEINYSAVIDDRRMIAVEVILFQGNGGGVRDGENVDYIFSGTVYGDFKLVGILTIKYSGGSEIIFDIIADKK